MEDGQQVKAGAEHVDGDGGEAAVFSTAEHEAAAGLCTAVPEAAGIQSAV